MGRYYPGFLAASLIILLRVAIGWHFLNEGVEKVDSTKYGKEPPFSAEIYLRNANGPFGPFFRGMLPDPTSADLRDPEKVKQAWTAEVDRIVAHYGFDDAQKGKAQEILARSLDWAEHWFHHHDNVEKLMKYKHDLEMVEKTEANTEALSFERERAWDARRLAETDRKALVAPIVAAGTELRENVEGVATPEQKASIGPIKSKWTSLDIANAMTMYGLVAIGFCLIAGLFTPFAAVCAAAFLAMIYLSMPPWPGLPPNPKTEGHYWIVSKNLIELIACLVIATTPSGYWLGFDALLFGPRYRRRMARRLERETAAAQDAA